MGLEALRALPEPPPGEAARRRQFAWAKGLYGSGQISYGLGDYQTGLEASQEAVRIFRLLGERSNLGYALSQLGNMAAFQGDLDLAEQALLEAIQLGREIGDKVMLCYALGVFSPFVSLPRGDIVTARAYAEESVRYAREIGVLWAEGQGKWSWRLPRAEMDGALAPA
jgi:tetratricopeptide (TPR) repeat protein